MRQTCQLIVIAVVSTPLVTRAAGTPQRFPSRDVGGRTLYATWLESSLVVMGDIVNTREYGVEKVKNLPWPVQSEVEHLYWCKGVLQVGATVKGKKSAKVLEVYWASVQKGCAVHGGGYKPQELTKVWFVRMDGPFAVLLDAHHYKKYLGLRARWAGLPEAEVRHWLGSVLLTPGTGRSDVREFADRIWENGDLACELLGREKCVSEAKKVAQREGGPVRDAVCQYLLAQQGTKCDP